MKLKDQVAIVTGAAMGIGRAMAEGLASEGARIVIADVAGAETAAKEMQGKGYKAVGVKVDVSFEKITIDEWRRVMDVNVMGMFLCCKAVVGEMRKNKGGRIINLSSGTPFKGIPFLLHYVTSKGAVITITRALAKELGGDNILVNAIAPGFTLSDGILKNETQMKHFREVSVKVRCLQRDQTPQDLVGAVVFLAGPDSSFITGQTINVDGGAYFH
ncbi:MAG: family oxidoreductase [Deltaproteobacteria bacterium]|nr:family oxidoreductase [Deltaproteobacteria bacterium]